MPQDLVEGHCDDIMQSSPLLRKYIDRYLKAVDKYGDATTEGLNALEVAPTGDGRVARHLLCWNFINVHLAIIMKDDEDMGRFYSSQLQNKEA